MELNIMGKGSPVTQGFIEDLKGLAQHKESSLDALGKWLLAATDVDNLIAADFFQQYPDVELDDGDFDSIVDVTLVILHRIFESGAGEMEIDADLKAVGLNKEKARKVRDFLIGLKSISEKVMRAVQRNYYETAGAQALSDLNFVCDLRAIFQGVAYEGSPMRGGHDRLLGFAPIVLMELVTLDGAGKDHCVTVQMNENQLNEFAEGVRRCLQQFAQLKTIAGQLSQSHA